MDFILHLSLLILTLILSAFFSAAETAIFSLNKAEKKRLTDKHRFFSKIVLEHIENPRRTLISILIGNMVVNTLATSIWTILIYRYLGPHWLSLSLLFFTALLIFACEIMPKTVAVGKNERVALLTALPLKVFVLLVFPFRKIVKIISDKILVFLIRDSKDHPEKMSEEEIKTLVKIGEEEGVLDSHERYMLQKLLALGERQVKEIMVPRTDMAALDVENSREENVALIRSQQFSHFPVYKGSTDNLLGVISAQDFMLFTDKAIEELIEQCPYVPEVKRIDDLLAEFRSTGQRFAVCVDEYGGTAGIVTMEDILEEVFGEFYDEYEKVEQPIRSIGHNEYIVDAKLPISDFNEFFPFYLKSEDASTLGGYLLEQLGELPEKGRTFKIPECEFVIYDIIRHRRIKSVLVKPSL